MRNRWMFRVVIEVLVLHPSRRHREQHEIPGFPIVPFTVDDRVTATLEDEDDESALMTVLARTLRDYLQEDVPLLGRGVL